MAQKFHWKKTQKSKMKTQYDSTFKGMSYFRLIASISFLCGIVDKLIRLLVNFTLRVNYTLWWYVYCRLLRNHHAVNRCDVMWNFISLPNDKILHLSKSKAVADVKLDIAQKMEICFGGTYTALWKKEKILVTSISSFFPQCFLC